MRIALVVYHFNPRLGGAEHWTWQFAKSLLAMGHEVHVAALTFAAEAAALGVVQHPVAAGGAQLRSRFAARAAEIVGRLPVDVVHDMGCGWEADVFQPHGGSRLASFEHNLRREPAWQRGCKRWLAPWLPRHREFAAINRRQYAQDGRLFIAISRMVSGHLQQLHGVPPEQIRLVYNGVDGERFSPALAERFRQSLRQELRLPEAAPVALIVAHNFELKGVPTAIDAVARLAARGSDAHLVVVGGKRLQRGQRWAAAAGVTDRVRFVGSVADPSPYYGLADLYVQPTWYDPCSLVALEALACGLPVLTTVYNGAGELITPGVEGDILPDPADGAAWAASIERFLKAPFHAQASQAARRLAESRTLERNCQEIVAIYHEQLRQSPRQAA